MFYAKDIYGNRIHISKALQSEKYFCPVCNCPVILKNNGEIVAHHFAHQSNKYCDPWYKGKMSQWHLDMQSLFPEESREVIVQTKDNTEFHIADVLLNTKNNQYVFEFQHSPISVQDFLLRSCFYIKLGYSLVWVFDLRDSQKPKCLFYEDLDYNSRYKHVIWPGKDRLKIFDSFKIRSFLEECQDDNINISIFFHAHTGHGKQSVVHYADGFESIKWEYINPLLKEEYFIRPDFDTNSNLSNFYAAFFSKKDFHKYIRKLIK